MTRGAPIRRSATMIDTNPWTPNAIGPDGRTAGAQVLDDFFRRLTTEDKAQALERLENLAVVTSSDAWQRLDPRELMTIKSWCNELETLTIRALGMSLTEFQSAIGLTLAHLAALAVHYPTNEGHHHE